MLITVEDLINYCADSNIELESLYQYEIDIKNKDLYTDIQKYWFTACIDDGGGLMMLVDKELKDKVKTCQL